VTPPVSYKDLGIPGGMTTTHPLPTAASVAEEAATVAPHVRRTPVLRAQVDGRPLVLKLEHLQRGGSFKLRGAVNGWPSSRPRRSRSPHGWPGGSRASAPAWCSAVPT
jgi:threonine dehydratase